MNKFFTKRNIFAVCLALVVLLCVVLSVFVAVFCTPSQFSQTYYGQLTAMVEKLENVQGKKIVIIGTSSVAFGINSALLQQLLLDAGEQYTVCNFGLYGALGVKLMMQLALPYVKQGDVVLFSPEIDSQVLSLYFSAQHTWRAFDGNFRLLKNLDEQQQKYMAGGVVDFLQEKFSAQQHGGLSVEGVYAKSSFDSNGDLTQFARPHNIMTNGVDSNNPVDFSTQ
ncbi:MAG: hypothetical protein IJF10_00935, partial [Clostridia bacterium]|nr:hypothetical protein [Clostridia bacterium]